jgi:hypothetical protein
MQSEIQALKDRLNARRTEERIRRVSNNSSNYNTSTYYYDEDLSSKVEPEMKPPTMKPNSVQYIPSPKTRQFSSKIDKVPEHLLYSRDDSFSNIKFTGSKEKRQSQGFSDVNMSRKQPADIFDNETGSIVGSEYSKSSLLGRIHSLENSQNASRIRSGTRHENTKSEDGNRIPSRKKETVPIKMLEDKLGRRKGNMDHIANRNEKYMKLRNMYKRVTDRDMSRFDSNYRSSDGDSDD